MTARTGAPRVLCVFAGKILLVDYGPQKLPSELLVFMAAYFFISKKMAEKENKKVREETELMSQKRLNTVICKQGEVVLRYKIKNSQSPSYRNHPTKFGLEPGVVEESK